MALTRAREKLIITGSVNRSAQDCIEDWKQKCNPDTGKPLDFYVLQSESYLDTMGLALCQGDVTGHFCITEGLYTDEPGVTQGGKISETEVVFGLPSMPLYDGAAGAEVTEVPQFAPAKVSVSELKRNREMEEETLPVIGYTKRSQKKQTQSKGYTAAQIGTLLHSALQHIDYLRISKDDEAMKQYAEELLLQMEDAGFILEDERKAVPVATLTSYLTSDFAERLSKASWMKREVPFTFLDSWQNLTGKTEPGETAVQGVIDLVCEIDGHLILVDFKSDTVEENFADYSKRYGVQLELYGQACFRAFGKKPDEIYLYYLRAGHGERIEG